MKLEDIKEGDLIVADDGFLCMTSGIPNMNFENLDKLIAHMEKMPNEAFNMSHWIATTVDFRDPRVAQDIIQKQETTHDCGTVACIAGEATLLAYAENSPAVNKSGLGYANVIGRAWLGLTHKEADSLFTPYIKDYNEATRENAIAVLKRVRETGEVKDQFWYDLGLEALDDPDDEPYADAL